MRATDTNKSTCMNILIRTCGTVLILLLCLSGCFKIGPASWETEWYIQPGGMVLLKDCLHDLCYVGSSTNKAIKEFAKFIDEMEPPILTPTRSEDDTNTIIRLRELYDKYGSLNWRQEWETPFEDVVKGFDIEIGRGFYWIFFRTNSATVETNGQTITHPDETEKLIVRWPTNTTYFWIKHSYSYDDDTLSLVEFWREYCAVGRDITLLTNKYAYIE